MAGEPTPDSPEFREAYAQDAISNTKVDSVGDDDIEFLDATKGPILRSANGTRYRITVDNYGRYQTEAVA